MRCRLRFLLPAATLLFACTTVPARDGGNDALSDTASSDSVALDTPSADSAAQDVVSDTGIQDDSSSLDSGVELDSGIDSATANDASSDVPFDARTDTLSDTRVDTGADTGRDTGVDTGIIDSATCGSPLTLCAGICVDTRTSRAHCGGCGRTCALPNALVSCTDGVCGVAGCNAGFMDCDRVATNGCEIDTNNNLSNCGACGRTCALANAVSTCTAGACAIASCNAGFADCDRIASNGCEVNTQTNVNNCGGCGRTCSLPNATATCTAGACAIAICSTGFANCDANTTNGCEVNTTSDPNNCGRCGTACGSAGICRTSACVSCASPAVSCGSYCANLSTDTNNCRACGYVCPPYPMDTPYCGASGCLVGAACDGSGRADCDRNPTNGYETDISSSATNCGACGFSCPGSRICCRGACVLSPASCPPIC